MEKDSFLSEADDLCLTPHVVLDSLPALLKDCLTLGKTTTTKDILLLSSLTAVSSVLPTISFRYAHYGKRYWPMLQTFILASPASGKGIADVAKQLIMPIHEANGLLIPGDSTYPAFYELLAEQNGHGFLFETEGSVITDIWRNSCCNYNTALRKIAEHELLSKNRIADGRSEIRNPKVAVLLTGTFSQFHALVPNIENGFFSRLSILVVRDTNTFDPTVFQPNAASVAIEARIRHWAIRLRELAKQLFPLKISFRLTNEQATRIGQIMAGEYSEFLQHLGEGFHASIIRNGVTLMRIAAILSSLRLLEDTNKRDKLLEQETPILECSDEDFQTAMILSTKLLLNSADAYNMIGGKQQVLVPAAQASYQRETFLSALPRVFTTGECITQAQSMGVCDRTIRRWINNWLETGQLYKSERGLYKKAG